MVMINSNNYCAEKKNQQPGSRLSVKMPASIEWQEIESASVCVGREKGEILWTVGKTGQDFHKKGHFHDALIKVANGQVAAHRHVLASASSWMRDRLQRETRSSSNSSKPMTEIRMEQADLDICAVKEIVDYLYTARCRLNYFNVYPIFLAASFLKLTVLIDTCQRLLDVLLSNKNVAVMLEIAEKAVGNKVLVDFVYAKWVEQFYGQIELPFFGEWPFERVYRLLSNDDIRVHSEMDILTTALRWINEERCSRTEYFVELMRVVRWMYLSQDELIQAVELEKLLISNKDVKQLITDAQWYKTCREYSYDWKEYSASPCRLMNREKCLSLPPVDLKTNLQEKSCDLPVKKCTSKTSRPNQ